MGTTVNIATSRERIDRWGIILIGFLLQVTSLGFGRFAYTVILPSMKSDLGFSHTQMGLLQTGIVTGYLLFAYLGGFLACRWTLVRTINLSVLACGLAMIGLGLVTPFWFLFILALITGAGASGAYVPLVSLIVGWFSSKRSGLPLGLAFSGCGVGIIWAGIFVPFLLAHGGPSAWRTSWISLGAMTLTVALISFFFLKDPPKGVENKVSKSELRSGPLGSWRFLSRNHSVRMILLIYFLVGLAYIMFATFFVTYAVEEVSVQGSEAGFMWSMFGIFSVLGCFLWGAVSDRFGRRQTMHWDLSILSVSTFLSVFWATRIGLYASVILFAFAFNGFITLIAAMFGDFVETERLGEVFGLSTLIHGLGMVLGASLAGLLRDMTLTFRIPFFLSGFIVSCCFFMFLWGDRKDKSGFKIRPFPDGL
jgi:MFS family permease